ncbi:hypothetical protein ARNL5_01526 [Anaerolineae bacterium]|nr:hypothetical protein ARNL5_01526 [Anaerolineae bacterium]
MGTGDDRARVSIPVETLGVAADAPLAEVAAGLLRQQQATWELLRTNVAGLANIRTRQFRFGGYHVRVQFNPGRLTSSAARVDERSVRERKCFLCLPHLPSEQRGVLYAGRFMLLCNPYPIFPEHFTIPHVEHVPQRIAGELGAFIALARDLAPRYSVFYNGPRCGASAPDHLHFQAGTRQFMPIEGQYARLRAAEGKVVRTDGTAQVIAIEGGGRRLVAFEGTDAGDVERVVAEYCTVLQGITEDVEEAMMNLIAWYEGGSWVVLLFPRAKHRPSFYFAEGDERLLISPAAVDLGGVSITPVEADFRKVTHEHLATMYQEVQLSRAEFHESIERR